MTTKLAIAGVLLAACGCGEAERRQSTPAKRVEIPNQEPMSYDEYPEWAKKSWGHLVVTVDEYMDVTNAWDMLSRHGRHYYVDVDSFDPERESYVTIENETVFLGDSFYKTTTSNVRGHFEGDPGRRGWIFPCVEPGKWHGTPSGIGISDRFDGSDVAKCSRCGRYRLVGRIEFQTETGNVQWSRY